MLPLPSAPLQQVRVLWPEHRAGLRACASTVVQLITELLADSALQWCAICYKFCMFQRRRPPAFPISRRACIGGLLAFSALPGFAAGVERVASSVLPQGARSISITQSQLQSAVAAKFPLARSWQGMVVIQLQKPAVQLLASSNSLRTMLDIWVTEKLMNTEYPGQIALDFGLYYSDADSTIRMQHVRVEQLHMQGVPPQYQPMFQTYAPRLAEQVLNGLAVYELPASQRMLLKGLGYTVHSMEVQADKLRIVLAPKPLGNG